MVIVIKGALKGWETSLFYMPSHRPPAVVEVSTSDGEFDVVVALCWRDYEGKATSAATLGMSAREARHLASELLEAASRCDPPRGGPLNAD